MLSLCLWGSVLGDGVEMTDRPEMAETLHLSPDLSVEGKPSQVAWRGQEVKETSKISG